MLSVSIAFSNTNLNLRHKLFLSLNMAKGVAVAVVAFILVSQVGDVPALEPIIDLSFLFILYSIILASVAEKFSFYLLKKVRI